MSRSALPPREQKGLPLPSGLAVCVDRCRKELVGEECVCKPPSARMRALRPDMTDDPSQAGPRRRPRLGAMRRVK